MNTGSFLVTTMIILLVPRPGMGEDKPQAAGAMAPVPGGESRACLACHSMPPAGHPVGIASARSADVRVPAELPLDRYGRLTCSTCHEAGPADGRHERGGEARGDGRFLLRADLLAASDRPGRNLCLKCHRERMPGGPVWHAIEIGMAHLGPRSLPADAFNPFGIDGISARCLACHDGTLGDGAEVRLSLSTRTESLGDHRSQGTMGFGSTSGSLSPPGRDRHGGGPLGSHPIGVAYPRIAEKRGEYRPRPLLDPRITLVDGNVACISCHNPYSRERYLLVFSNRRSRLCMACHEL